MDLIINLLSFSLFTVKQFWNGLVLIKKLFKDFSNDHGESYYSMMSDINANIVFLAWGS